MAGETLHFSRHAITQMFARRISRDDVVALVAGGETIERYDRERPYPSRLLLGFRGGRPLHIVAADDRLELRTIVVTVYIPDPALWQADWKTRKKT